MVQQHDIDLTLDEFASEVAFTLERYQLLGIAQDNRVSPVPDGRTIRYYTGLGLLDRPRLYGRQAKYGRRHLLQLLSIKALQGQGLPLSDIQSRIYGLSDRELESMLAAIAEIAPQHKPQASIRPILWKEIVIEPGLKLMLEDGWSPGASLDEIEAKIRAVLAALAAK